MKTDPRAQEADDLRALARLAQTDGGVAADARMANLAFVASGVVGVGFRSEGQRLAAVAQHFFAAAPSLRLPTADVIRQGWIIGLPRFREGLERVLRGPA